MHRNCVHGTCLAAALLLAGCASVKSYWPFGRDRAPGPQAVMELELSPAAVGQAGELLQYWERNTLVVDLQNAPASGQVVLARRSDRSWPARIALRMSAQRFEVAEVRGAQRVVLPVASGASAVTAELPPGVYDSSTPSLTLRWGAKEAF